MAIKNSTTSFDDLPEETASNILLRLPVKALIRSTSVNKKCRASDDYRVVRIVYDRVNKMNAAKVEFLLVGNDTAREDGRNHRSKDLWILSFDFDDEVFGELKVSRNVYNCIGTSALFKLMEFKGSLALCIFDAQCIKGVVSHPYRIWLMRQEKGVISWILRFTASLKQGGLPINITKSGIILIEMYNSPKRVGVTSILSCDLNTMRYKDLGFGKPEGVDDSILIPEPCSIDTSFTESLVMYEGGKSLLKFAK
ncbi:hypothetical protein AgCh_024390 [Apium graveolens]